MIKDAEIIKLVTARLEGKKILHLGKFTMGNACWTIMRDSDEWDFAGYDYMVEPEPRTLYTEIMPDGRHIQSSLEPFVPTNGGSIVTFKEVRHE